MYSAKNGRVSLLVLGTTLLTNRWRIGRWIVFGVLIALVLLWVKAGSYVASVSFVPETNEGSRSGLASLAGQFGMALPGGSASRSPEFYAHLVESRVILGPITRDTLLFQKGVGKTTFDQLFDVDDGPAAVREERGVATLKRIITVTVAKNIGVVEVSVKTRWPQISLAIATEILKGVNDYNQRTRRSQATEERKFVEERLAVAAAELRATEDRLEGFLRSNREFVGSAELSFQRERLQRDVSLKQQVFTSLTQAYDDVRIREVRNTPAITILEPPSVPASPESRGIIMHLLLGSTLGVFFGVLVTLISEALARRRAEGNPEATEFLGALLEAKQQMLGSVRALKQQIGR